MPIQNLFTTTQLAHQIETIGSAILGLGRFRPGPPNSNNALLMRGIFFHGELVFDYEKTNHFTSPWIALNQFVWF
jgi:hypothetical protein